MAFSPSSRALRCLLIAGLPLACAAGTSGPPDEAQQAIDRDLQTLKAEVLDLNQRALSAEASFLYPDETRVSIYIGVLAPGLLVEDVVITVDDSPPTVRKFDVVEAIALQRRGLYRALRVNATPGGHRIRFEFSARYADAKPGTPALRGRYEAVFEKTVLPSDLEVLISVSDYGKPATIRLRDWRPLS